MLTPEQALSYLNEYEARLHKNYSHEVSSNPGRGRLSDWRHGCTLRERDTLVAEYLEAARVISAGSGEYQFAFINAWVQLAGHAVELSLKVFVASHGQDPMHSHDLVQLAREALIVRIDFAHTMAVETIVHLNHLFFQELGTKHQHPARYGGQAGAVLPNHDEVEALVDSIRTQYAGVLGRS